LLDLFSPVPSPLSDASAYFLISELRRDSRFFQLSAPRPRSRLPVLRSRPLRPPRFVTGSAPPFFPPPPQTATRFGHLIRPAGGFSLLWQSIPFPARSFFFPSGLSLTAALLCLAAGEPRFTFSVVPFFCPFSSFIIAHIALPRAPEFTPIDREGSWSQFTSWTLSPTRSRTKSPLSAVSGMGVERASYVSSPLVRSSPEMLFSIVNRRASSPVGSPTVSWPDRFFLPQNYPFLS